MEIRIVNPAEDQYGNAKENIFLAFDQDQNYLGAAYTFPALNHHQTYERPYTLYIDISLEHPQDDLVQQMLFDRVTQRAKELRRLQPDLKARIYTGFDGDKDKLNFYLKNGFEEDYSILMEAPIPAEYSIKLPAGMKIIEESMNTDQDLASYKRLYDELFISPLNLDAYQEQKSYRHFKRLSFYLDGCLQGGCTLFEKDGRGHIETLFVMPKSRGKGLAKVILSYAFSYFHSMSLGISSLEVWTINKRAVKLYESFGYQEVKKVMCFPGINL